MANIEAVFTGLTDTLTRSHLSAAVFETVTEQELPGTVQAIHAHLRLVEAVAALGAAKVAKLSDPALGLQGFASRNGHATPEAMLQELSGASKAATRRQVAVGTMMAEAEAAHGLEEQAAEHPEDEFLAAAAEQFRPWHASLGDAVTTGTIGAETAAGIRAGLGEPADGVTPDLLAEALNGIITDCTGLSWNADQARKAAYRVRDQIDAAGVAARAEAKRARQYWKQGTRPDGMVHGEYLLDPENGAFVTDIYDQLTTPKRGGPRFIDPEKKAWATTIRNDPRTPARIAVDGLIELLRIGATADPGTVFGGNRPAVKILVTETTLQNAQNGQSGFGAIEGNPAAIDLPTVDRHLCTDGFVPILFDADGQCLDLGREQRLFTKKQRQALAARDGGCMDPECDRPPSWCEAHHINEWVKDAGLTDIADGILLCKRDHLRLHNQGWRIERRNSNEYWLIPPTSIDPQQTPIQLRSKTPLKLGNPIRPPAPPAQENSA